MIFLYLLKDLIYLLRDSRSTSLRGAGKSLSRTGASLDAHRVFPAY